MISQYPNYGVVNGQKAGSYNYIQSVLGDLDMQQTELKVKILSDKVNAADTTPEQKNILQSMLNDANKELATLKQKHNIK